MNLPLYIAGRYLFSKKSLGVINIISGISVCGVAFATLALVCTLSVFNGFRNLVAELFTAFDPQLKITAVGGKTFAADDTLALQVVRMPEVDVVTACVEEHALVRYGGRQAVVTLKGVEDNFRQLTSIDSILYGNGEFKLRDELVDYGIPGIQLASALGTGLHPADPIEVFAPKREAKVNVANPGTAFRRGYLFSPGVVFGVNQAKYDAAYVLTSLAFVRELFAYENELTSLELKLKAGIRPDQVQRRMQRLLGDRFRVENRYEQQADVFRIMEIEKLISYLFLTFILLVACFNIVGSLSMLIIDKKEDVRTLRNLGADNRLITRIFLFEGWLISLCGSLLGIVLGVGLCLLQQHFGLIALGTGGSFLVDAYPVSVQVGDILLVLVTVLVVGFLSVLYPVKNLSRRLL